LAWAIGVVRVTRATKRPAMAKRRVEMDFMGLGFVWRFWVGVFPDFL